MEPQAIFITDDRRMRDGQLDPTDELILRQAGGGGAVMQVSPEEALTMLKPGTPGSLTGPRKPLPPGLHELKPQDMQTLGEQAGITWKYFQQEVARLMNDERAAYVRRLRVDRRYTWRKVARACSQAWGTDWESNQIAGIAICEAAARYFFEDYRKPPWN